MGPSPGEGGCEGEQDDSGGALDLEDLIERKDISSQLDALCSK